jgi:thiol-disulfide isomerase/thioredoxin
MKPPAGWDRVERALAEANPVPPAETAGRGADAERRDRLERIVSHTAPRSWRISKAVGAIAGATGVAAVAAVLGFLIVAAPEDGPRVVAGGIEVGVLERPAGPEESAVGASLLSEPVPGRAGDAATVDPSTVRLALRAKDLSAYAARDASRARICLLIDPRAPDPKPRPAVSPITACRSEEEFLSLGTITETAPGVIPGTAGPDRVPIVVLVPDGIESIEIAGEREAVARNVARLEMATGRDPEAILRGPAAIMLRERIDPELAQPPLDKSDPSVAVRLFGPPPAPPAPLPSSGLRTAPAAVLPVIRADGSSTPAKDGPADLADLRPYAVLFAGPGCTACRVAIASLERRIESRPEHRLPAGLLPVVVWVGDLASAREWVTAEKDVTVLHDPGGEVTRRFGVDPDHLPATILVGRDGRYPGPPTESQGTSAIVLGESVAPLERARLVAQALEEDPDCRTDPGTLVKTHSQTSATAFAVQGAGGTRGVIVVGSGRLRWVCAPPDAPLTDKRLVVEYGIDSNLVAGVVPDGYTQVRANGQVREVRENVFLVEQPTGVAREVTLSGPGGEVTLPVPPPELAVSPLPKEGRPIRGPLDEKLTVLRAGDLGQAADGASISDLKGRPAFLLFVAPGCPPCDEALATLRDDARRETRRDDVRAVVIVLGRDEAGNASVLARVPDPDAPVLHDAAGRTTESFGLDGLPGWVALDAEGHGIGRGGAGGLPVHEVTTGARASSGGVPARGGGDPDERAIAVFAASYDPDCRLDAASTRLARATTSGVRAYTAQAAKGRKGLVILFRDGVFQQSCRSAGATTSPLSQGPTGTGGVWVGGLVPPGYTRAIAHGVEVPVVDGVVLMEAGREVAQVTLTGPAGRLVLEVDGALAVSRPATPLSPSAAAPMHPPPPRPGP